MNCSYNLPKNNIGRHLEIVSKALDEYYPKCGKTTFPGEFITGI